MLRYIGKRLLMMIPILIAVAILIFTLMYLVPGDPVSISASQTGASEAEIERMRDAMGLNDPYLIQLGRYMNKLFLHFDMGTSYRFGTSVASDLVSRFPKTFLIASFSIILSVLGGIPIGVRSAVRANSLEDRIYMALTLLGCSIPNFWLALMLMLLFSLKLGWFPSTGADSLACYVLPSIACALGGIAGIARQTRASMLEVIHSDYVTTARAKGLSEKTVIYKHALKNALIPIITICGATFGRSLGGTIVVETIFAFPGIGTYLIDSINLRDYNAVQGSIVYVAFIFSIVMLLIDIIYAYVDPRIKAQYIRKPRKEAHKNE